MRVAKGWLVTFAFAGLCAASSEAEAQYRNFTFGFEGGYQYFGAETDLKPNTFSLGMFGGYKADPHWWFYAKTLVAFPGQSDNAPNTVIALQLVPASVRYYFLTDRFRPFVGATNAFTTFFNSTAGVRNTFWWGPGASAGFDLKLQRDLYLGLVGDAYYLFNFDGPDAPMINGGATLTFFL